MLNQNFIPHFIKIGLFGGLIYVAMNFCIYAVSPELYLNPMFKIIPLLSVLFTMLYSIQYRIDNGDVQEIVYKDLVQASFVAYLFSELLFQGYTFALHNYIHESMNPDLGSMNEFIKSVNIQMEKLKYDRIGARPVDYEIMQAHIEAEDYTLTFNRLLAGYARWIVGGFLVSFVLAMFGMFRVKSLRNGRQ